MQNQLFTIIFIVELLFLSSQSTTHWFLNNEGKIQAQMDSIYQLRRPYDFLALIQQEERAKHVEQLKRELVEQKAHIDKNEDKDTQLEERIYRTYTDCILAGRPLTEFDLYASATLDLKTANINVEDHVDFTSAVPSESTLLLQQPGLDDALPSMPFSMFLLEHLKGMRLRSNLSAPAEEASAPLWPEGDPSVWGHRVWEALQRNGTSWVLHSLSAQFWRAKGDAPRAMEAIRRAIYFSTRDTRHVPLWQLGSLLHRSRESEDAAIALHMSVDHHRRHAHAHEALGCVYASVGYYNESVLCLENALHLSPRDDALHKLKHAVLCHAHLEAALEKQLQSLQQTLVELRGYQKKHDEWLHLQQKLLLEQATPEMKLESRLEYEEQKIRESADGRGQDCFQYQQDGHTFLSCNMRRDQLDPPGASTELLLDLQGLLHTVESETMRLGQQVLKRKPSIMLPSASASSASSVPLVTPLAAAPTPSPSPSASSAGLTHAQAALSNAQRTKTSSSSPSSKDVAEGGGAPDCSKGPPLPPGDALPTVFLPSENKGYDVETLLRRVPLLQQEEDPSPVCTGTLSPSPSPSPLRDLSPIQGIGAPLSPTPPDFSASPSLNHYGLHLYDVETDLKIASALNHEGPSRWVFLNLAGLYWRVEGHLQQGLDCLRQAVREAPGPLMDVPLVNLASLLYKGGHVEGALQVALRALKVNDTEAPTHFLVGNLLLARGNLTGAAHYYERVLGGAPPSSSSSPSHAHAHARRYLAAIACHAHAHTPPPAVQKESHDKHSTTTLAKTSQDGGATTDATCRSHGDQTSTQSTSKNVNTNSNALDVVASVERKGKKEKKCLSTSAPASGGGAGGGGGPKKESPAPQDTAKANLNKQIHVRIGLGPESASSSSPPPEGGGGAVPPLEDDPLPDVLLRVRERSPPSSALPPHLCDKGAAIKDVKLFTSTWLSVSAKGIDLSEYLVPPLPKEGGAPPLEEPVCLPDFPASLHTFDHLAGVKHRARLPHYPELGLKEAFQTLTDETSSHMDAVATRIARSLRKNETSWVLATAAALYWRVTGDAHRALDCLRLALHHAPRNMKDIPLISMANIFHRSDLLNNALIVGSMALEISPNFVVIHFTMANMYAAKGDLDKAIAFYQSTLSLQSSFEPARERLIIIQCAVAAGRDAKA